MQKNQEGEMCNTREWMSDDVCVLCSKRKNNDPEAVTRRFLGQEDRHRTACWPFKHEAHSYRPAPADKTNPKLVLVCMVEQNVERTNTNHYFKA